MQSAHVLGCEKLAVARVSSHLLLRSRVVNSCQEFVQFCPTRNFASLGMACRNNAGVVCAAAAAAGGSTETLPTAVGVSDEQDEKRETKLWGGRFEKPVTPAVERFSQSVSYDKQLYKQDLMGSRAHAQMLAKQGLMTDENCATILTGLKEIERRIENGEFIGKLIEKTFI